MALHGPMDTSKEVRVFSTDALGYVPTPPAHRARARLKRVGGQVDSTVTRPGGVRLRFLSTGNEGAAIDLPILSRRLTPEPQRTQEKKRVAPAVHHSRLHTPVIPLWYAKIPRLPSDRDAGTYLFGFPALGSPKNQSCEQKMLLSRADPVQS